jgi:hypothetical protein
MDGGQEVNPIKRIEKIDPAHIEIRLYSIKPLAAAFYEGQ